MQTTTKRSCYDCGSLITGHHTVNCDLAGDEIRDLPVIPDTQYWNGELPEGVWGIEAYKLAQNVRAKLHERGWINYGPVFGKFGKEAK